MGLLTRKVLHGVSEGLPIRPNGVFIIYAIIPGDWRSEEATVDPG